MRARGKWIKTVEFEIKIDPPIVRHILIADWNYPLISHQPYLLFFFLKNKMILINCKVKLLFPQKN